MTDKKIQYIDSVSFQNKRIFLRIDCNVSLHPDHTIADDARIKQSIPSILSLSPNNKLILASHMGRPVGREKKYSMRVVMEKIKQYIPDVRISLVEDFRSVAGKKMLSDQRAGEILMLENLRFYPEEKNDEANFASELASLADIYVNDAFAVSHRSDASIVGVPAHLPAYGGLLLKKEIEMISKAINKPKKPFVAIIGGAKIETKINLIGKLTEIADYVLIGGGLANTFLCAHGYEIGKSFCEYEKVAMARHLLFLAAQKHTAILLPSDVVVGDPKNATDAPVTKKITDISPGEQILDIGSETKAKWGAVIAKAKTIIWNGPVGYFENPSFRQGTDFIYYAIAENGDSTSIVGGGETIAAISKKEYLDKITHISTGGGAMLEFIEKGTLPGIEALKK